MRMFLNYKEIAQEFNNRISTLGDVKIIKISPLIVATTLDLDFFVNQIKNGRLNIIIIGEAIDMHPSLNEQQRKKILEKLKNIKQSKGAFLYRFTKDKGWKIISATFGEDTFVDFSDI